MQNVSPLFMQAEQARLLRFNVWAEVCAKSSRWWYLRLYNLWRQNIVPTGTTSCPIVVSKLLQTCRRFRKVVSADPIALVKSVKQSPTDHDQIKRQRQISASLKTKVNICSVENCDWFCEGSLDPITF